MLMRRLMMFCCSGHREQYWMPSLPVLPVRMMPAAVSRTSTNNGSHRLKVWISASYVRENYCSQSSQSENLPAVRNLLCPQLKALCGLRGWKNKPALFSGRMLWKATKPGSVCSLLALVFYTAPNEATAQCIVIARLFVCLFVGLLPW